MKTFPNYFYLKIQLKFTPNGQKDINIDRRVRQWQQLILLSSYCCRMVVVYVCRVQSQSKLQKGRIRRRKRWGTTTHRPDEHTHTHTKSQYVVYYNVFYYDSPLLTLLILSLYFKSPSMKRCRPCVDAQPFIGPHKSNILLYCFDNLSRCSLFESCLGIQPACMCTKLFRKCVSISSGRRVSLSSVLLLLSWSLAMAWK